MELKTRENVQLYYEEKGQGEPIIFIHGWSGNSEFFKPQLEELSRTNRVIIYDLKGHGKSDIVDRGLTLESFAQDLDDLIEILEVEKPSLIGWSMGAMIVFEYIKQFGTDNISKVGILDMTPKLVNDKTWSYGLNHGIFIEEDQKDALSLLFDDYALFLREFIKYGIPYLTEDELEEVFEESENNSPLVLAAMWHSMGINDYRGLLHHIDVETMIIYGGKSTLYNKDTSDYMAKIIDRVKVIEFEDATHFLVVEEQARLTREIDNFINN